jgi:hypothetical protein
VAVRLPRTSGRPLDSRVEGTAALAGLHDRKEKVESLFGKPPTQGRDLSRLDDIDLLDGEASLGPVGDTVKRRPRSAANGTGNVPATAKIFLRDGEPEAPRGADDERSWRWHVNLREWAARSMSGRAAVIEVVASTKRARRVSRYAHVSN